MVLRRPATKTTSCPRSEAVSTGAADISTASSSPAISAGSAALAVIDSTSTSTPSLINAPVSFAIHSGAIVPEVLR